MISLKRNGFPTKTQRTLNCLATNGTNDTNKLCMNDNSPAVNGRWPRLPACLQQVNRQAGITGMNTDYGS